ncbi:competence type IV pilus minor pilin ComGD [Streptococcus castoreus]|uniref:competence type IV pilus minor pilin ComGD n=1 Tax=Streptococcus castoreus TaxID=254786 RepID=UPI000481E693|nr:competence type IV pilus minor pilin ComGD [Streptococcus castoreus]
MKNQNLNVEAFTLLETLFSLFVMSFVLIGLSLPVTSSYKMIQENLFFTRFEYLYRHQQKLAILHQEKRILTVSLKQVEAKDALLRIPESIKVKTSQRLVLDQRGGNHSLAKIYFEKGDQQITYQFYLGSGNYQKTSRSVHSS